MKIIDGIKLTLWLIENNRHNEYNNLIDFLIESMNKEIDLQFGIRGYRKG